MLNKIKKIVLPMLDTLGEALTQYLEEPSQELLDGIASFMNAIDMQVRDESHDAVVASQLLKESLKDPKLPELEQLFNKYCSVIEELPVQYKAVFLPYYDNTWDSLASVYDAFAADPVFVTEIVIIPIRRNTPTGWKMVYEDYLTPKGIPNTHFSNYSFDNDLPDVVFYNNPYDGVNIEKFQSQNIKPYAGCMVYVPYFLYQHMFQGKEILKKSVEQHAQLSGHDNADVFIVQGKSFLKTFARRSRNGKKMVELGNPKTDNIYKHMHNYPRYPEWDKATDGKTVFMLNTHYASAIAGDVFISPLLDFFEQNDDLALIWRPHPQSFLMLDKDNRSESFLKWQGYLDRVNNHERMILDRTSSSLSAIMYSDALLSYESSIVAESIFADKPVFLLTPEPRERMSNEAWANSTVEEHMKKFEKIREYDIKNLYLFSAVSYLRLEQIIPKEEVTFAYWTDVLIPGFIRDISNGIDKKKTLRGLFREQLFVNTDGTCGQKIHDYIVSLIEQ